ncbi:MAG: hypothetical protein RIT04_217 [Candidatus Parcubacteria bacterium]|jgi:hypothetical protein
MFRALLKKISIGIITLSVVFSTSGAAVFLTPKPAEAQWITNDPISLAQSIAAQVVNYAQKAIQIGIDALNYISNYSMKYKAFVLDPIAYAIAKALLQQLTASVVNWINSGFNGSPSFLTDPGSFFMDITDQVVGEYVEKNGQLKKLCSNFGIDLRIALSFKYRPYSQKTYECTLSGIINKLQKPGSLISINGFTAGDFAQGNWPAFVSLTTEPQNNFMGAYLQADSELSYRIADRKAQQKDELNQGRGFLSWKKCTDAPPSEDETAYGEGYEDDAPTKNQDCKIQTPGSVISDALNIQIKSPTETLQLADSFNEIINALFAQLLTQILNGGLKSASGSGPNDASSYINQLKNEKNTQNNLALESIRTQLITSIEDSLGRARQFKANKDAAFNIVVNAGDALQAVIDCWSAKMSSSTSDAYYQSKIDEVTAIITTQVGPTYTTLLQQVVAAQQMVDTLTQAEIDANNAETIAELDAPSQQFNNLFQSGILPSLETIGESQNQIGTIQTQMTPIIQNATTLLNQCKSSQ